MSKKINLEISNPCHENWQQMTDSEKGRFCGACQKEVVDFTNMNDQQLVAFFRKPVTGSVCGRFQQDQLSRDLIIPKKRIPWVKYFFQFTLPAFLITMKAGAQKSPTIMGTMVPVCVREVKGEVRRNIEPIEKAVLTGGKITGKIVDAQGVGIPFAEIILTGTKSVIVCDTSGFFEIKVEKPGKAYTLRISSPGFESRAITIESTNVSSEIILEKEALSPAIMGKLKIVTKPKVKSISLFQKMKPFPLLQKTDKDIPFNHFKIFPNPVLSASEITVEWNGTKNGEHVFQLLSQSGQIVQHQEIFIGGKGVLPKIHLIPIVAGTYFVTITDKKTGKGYTEKVIFQ